MVYDIKAAYGKGQFLNVVSIRDAFVTIFRHKYRYRNKCWYRFIGPHWEEMKEDVDSFLLKEVRGSFYNAAILSVINWLEKNGGRYSKDQSSCSKGVWEHKKMLFKSKEIETMFTKLTANFHELVKLAAAFGG